MNPEERYHDLTKELNALREKATNGTMTADERQDYRAKIEAWKEVKAEVEELHAIAASASAVGSEFDRLSQGRGSAAGVPPRDPSGVDPRLADRHESKRLQTLGQRVTSSEEYAAWKDGNFKGNTGKIEVGSFYRGRFAGAEPVEINSLEDQYALIRAGGMPTDWISPMRVPGIFAPDLPLYTVRSAFLNLQTTQKVISYYRELSRTNNAAFVSEATATTGVTGLKPESAATWERDTSIVETLADWMPITNELADDDPAMRGIIEGILVDMLADVEDHALISGTGTSPQIRGLLNVSGIQVANAAYFTASPVADAGTANENFNRLLRVRRLVRQVGRATPSFYFINPVDMEKFMSATDSTRNYLAGGPFSAGPIPTIWRLPVIETESITAGTFVCGDGRMAAVFDRMAATVTSGWINDQFVRNMFTILAEERLAFSVFRPAAFVSGTFA
jgi:hypothetical protein